MSDKIRLKMDLYDVKLMNLAVLRMIGNGEAIIRHSLLKGSTTTKEEIDMLCADVKRLQAIREYLTTEIEKSGSDDTED